MNQELQYTLLLGVIFIAVFTVAEVMYHLFKVKAELTRKFVHASSGVISLLFPILLTNHWLVLLLCGSFALILWVSLKYNFLSSIHLVGRVTCGSFIFPLVVYGSFLAYIHFGSLSFFFIPILILALCDPIAALIGKKYPRGIYTVFNHSKTLSGSFAFMGLASIISFVALKMSSGQTLGVILVQTLIISLATTFSEAISHKGFDNFTIPGSAILVLYWFVTWI
jgi:phytol kinase